MLNNVTIKARLIGVAVAAVLVILGLSGVNFYSSRRANQSLADVYERQVLPTSALLQIDGDLREVRFRMAGVLLDQMPAVGSLNHLNEVRVSVPAQWARFKELTRDNQFNDKGKALIQKIDKQMAALPPFFDKLAQAYGNSDKAALSSLLEDDWPLAYAGVLKPLSQLLPVQQAAVKATYDRSVARARDMLAINGITLAVSLVVILGLTLQAIRVIGRNIELLDRALAQVADGDLGVSAQIRQKDELGRMADSLNRTLARLRDIVGGVKRAADAVAESSDRLTAEAHEVMARAQQQGDGIMQVSAAMEQTSVSVSEVAQSAGGVEQAAANTQAIAREGTANMEKSTQATQRIVDAVASSSSTIGGLSQSIDRVGEITRVIKEIADQTNLLALNAAIEAARAGEQGRGFAVVADEVRKLAERTAASTTDIANMVGSIKGNADGVVTAIGRIQEEVTTGAEHNRSAATTLQRIVHAADEVSGMARQIADAVKEQSVASQDVARNTEKISSLTEENNASIRQVDLAAKDLAGTAAELKRLVGQFKLNV